MVVGSDRVAEFTTIIKKYNSVKARHGFYKFDTIEVVSAGERDPDADDVSGMSASKMRHFAEIGEQLYKELYGLKSFITNLTKFMEHLVIAKQIIIVALNRVKSIGTFKQTATGFELVNPEGYVAIDTDGSAVKLVDRMEFAFNNFTAIKAWDK